MSIEINSIKQNQINTTNNLITFKSGVNTTTPQSYTAKRISVSNNQQSPKNDIPLSRKLGIGFASLFAILYTVGVGIRRHNFNKTSIKGITKELSKVFRRNLTENETKEIIGRYKELFKIDDAETFTKKAFEQVKKDYGYEKADIPLTIKYENMWKFFLKNPFKNFQAGFFNSINPSIKIVASCSRKNKLDKVGKLDIIECLYHELKHMEQSHLCYLKDKERFFNSLVKNEEKWRNVSLFEKIDKFNELNINYNRAFKNVPKKDISKYNETIDKLIKNNENYKGGADAKLKDYKKQILEEEAYNAGTIGTKFMWQFMWLDKGSLFYKPKGFISYGLMGASALCFTKDGYDTFNKTNKK